MLADLDTGADAPRRCRETGCGEGFGDVLGDCFDVLTGRIYAAEDRLHATPGEILDRGFAADFAQVAHGSGGEVVVGVAQACPADGGELEAARGAAPAPALTAGRCGGLGLAGFDESVEVTAHARSTESQLLPDLGCGDGSVLDEKLHDGGTGLALVCIAAAHGTGRLRRRRVTWAFLLHVGCGR